MSLYWQGLEVTIKLVSDYFWTQVYITAFDLGLNIFLEVWPIVIPADEVLGFIDTKIFCQRVVMILTDDLCLNGFRYKR